jgi:hypothetical protein
MAAISANTFYNYTNEKQGAFNGGVYSGTTQVPHPIAGSPTNPNDIIIDYSAVALGGFSGLNS